MTKLRRAFLPASIVLFAFVSCQSVLASSNPEDLLAKKIKDVNVKMSLDKAITQITKLTSVRFVVDWKALAATGVAPSTQVEIVAAEMTGKELLDKCLSAVAKPDKPLLWYIDTKLVTITSQESYVVIAKARNEKPAQVTANGASINFDSLPLSDVMDYIRDVADINLVVNWDSLAKIGVGKDTPVTMKLRNVSLGRVLDIILDSISAGQSKLDRAYCMIDGNVMTIGTGHDFNEKTSTGTFDIADLLMPIPDFKGPRFDVNALTSGQDGSIKIEQQQTGPTQEEIRNAMIERLTAMIKSSIGDEMWGPTGKGSVDVVGDKLVVTQTQLGWKLLARNL